MRKFVVLAATVASLSLSTAALALVSEEKDVSISNNDGAVTSGTVKLETASGQTIAEGKIVNGKAHLKVDNKDITPKTKVVVKVHTDPDPKTGKPAKDTEKRDEAIGVFFDKGLNVDTGGAALAAGGAATGDAVARHAARSNLRQISVAVHNPAPAPMSFTAPLRMEDVTFLQFGVLGGNSWMKTNANDFGTGLGGSTLFPHTNSSAFVAINAGMFFPVFHGVSFGPVLQLASGDLGTTTVTQTTPSGIIGSGQITRGVTFDAMGRTYIEAPGYWNASLFVQGGVEVAKFTGSMVNSGIETFQTSTTVTSGIVGGGVQFPLCGPLGIPVNGVCPLQAEVEFDHVFDNKTFFTGMTGPSSATATVNGENRVMGGLNLVSSFGNAPNTGRYANFGF
jgi:hypothetical protein